MGMIETTKTPAATEIRNALADIKEKLAVFDGKPLLTEDVSIIAEAVSALPREQMQEQIRHQLTLARYWHKVATTLVDGAVKAAEREATLLNTVADAHRRLSEANNSAAEALSLAAALRKP